MMEELHVTDNPADIGFYSGLVVSLSLFSSIIFPTTCVKIDELIRSWSQDSIFSIAQLFTIYQWGKLSDRIGQSSIFCCAASFKKITLTIRVNFHGFNHVFASIYRNHAIFGFICHAHLRHIFRFLSLLPKRPTTRLVYGPWWCRVG